MHIYQLSALEMAKIAPMDEGKRFRKAVKFQNYEDALSSRYQTAGPKVDAKDDKDRFLYLF